MVFDLRTGSSSWLVLRDYHANAVWLWPISWSNYGTTSGAIWKLGTLWSGCYLWPAQLDLRGDELPKLTADDEGILDRVWAERATQLRVKEAT